jgi:hypothetical protein
MWMSGIEYKEEEEEFEEDPDTLHDTMKEDIK